jgi:hypothetical protein
MDSLLAEGLLRQFKVNRQVKDTLSKWAAKMAELLVLGLPKDQWVVEIYHLNSYCQRNKLQQFASFDPLQQFSAFMEEWRSLVIGRNQSSKHAVTSSANSSNPPSRFAEHDEHPSLTELLLDNLNLNLQCEADLQQLEQRLIQQIKAGSKLDYTVSQVRNFCRCHAGEKGFYDERGRLNYLVGVWYDIVNESQVPAIEIDSFMNIATDDDGDFDSIMQDISNYVNIH